MAGLHEPRRRHARAARCRARDAACGAAAAPVHGDVQPAAGTDARGEAARAGSSACALGHHCLHLLGLLLGLHDHQNFLPHHGWVYARRNDYPRDVCCNVWDLLLGRAGLIAAQNWDLPVTDTELQSLCCLLRPVGAVYGALRPTCRVRSQHDPAFRGHGVLRDGAHDREPARGEGAPGQVPDHARLPRLSRGHQRALLQSLSLQSYE
mmetsp:Transcript_16865/g.48163  ORF Transcript_16865/g.48163 Transcript_16865/m.48163 type:complete len:208 (+) Transcript_16865:963-1586(+)